MPFKPPKQEKCMTCGKSVYAAERMEAGGNIFHKMCFKCGECSHKVTQANYKQDSGKLYCTNCFQKCVTSQNTQAAIIS